MKKTIYILDIEFIEYKAKLFARQKHASGTPDFIKFRKRLTPTMLREFDHIYLEERKKLLK